MTTISRASLDLPYCAPRDEQRRELCLTDPVDQPLCVYRGDTSSFMIVVTEADMTTPIDISTATWDADIRLGPDDADPVAYLAVTPHPGEPHIADVVLTASESEKLTADAYVYDVEMTLNGNVTTLVAGALTVTKDVSR